MKIDEFKATSGKPKRSMKRSVKRALIGICLVFPVIAVLAPFPGCGLIYSITDPLRGHPHRAHGTQPEKFLGMWMQENPVEYGFRAASFILLDDSNIADGPGMSFRRWHVEGDTFYGDYMSRCGNCYAGNRTAEYRYEFDSPDRMRLAHIEGTYNLRYSGWYKRTDITEELLGQLIEMREDRDKRSDPLYMQAHWALLSIEDAGRRGLDVPDTSFRQD